MKTQIISIIIPFFGKDISEDFEMRYKLVDFIEDNDLGEIVEEGTGEDGMHIIAQVTTEKKFFENKIRSFLSFMKIENIKVS